MIRIMTEEEPARTLITVDGQLTGAEIGPLESCCEQAISQGKPVRLFLREVSLIDEGGRALLRRLSRRGVGLEARGVYSSYVVAVITPQRAGRSRA